jgi:hypothetical protein
LDGFVVGMGNFPPIGLEPEPVLVRCGAEPPFLLLPIEVLRLMAPPAVWKSLAAL